MRGGLSGTAAAVVASILLFGTGATALADSELRQALSQVPGRMALGKEAFPARFLSLRALRMVAGEDVRGPEWRKVSVILGDAFQAYQLNTDESWRDRTGSNRNELASLVAYGEPSAQVLVWRFVDPIKVASFVNGLSGHGFKNEGGLWRDGEPMVFDKTKTNPADPFSGGLGRASMIMPMKDGIAQSAQPEAAIEAGSVKAEQSLAAQASIAVSLDAIEAAAGEGHIIQALVLSPGVWSLAVDPADIMFVDPGPDMKKIAEKARQPRVEQTLGAILVDVRMASSTGRGAVLSLPYADCKTAEQAGKLFDERWRRMQARDGKTAAEATGVLPSISIIQVKGACVALISTMQQPEASISIPIFDYIVSAINRRDFQAL